MHVISTWAVWLMLWGAAVGEPDRDGRLGLRQRRVDAAVGVASGPQVAVRKITVPLMADAGTLKRMPKRPQGKSGAARDIARHSAGVSGVEVYRNTQNLLSYEPGAGIAVADDLVTTCPDGGLLKTVEFAVSGGGSGSGSGFSAEYALYDQCPASGGVMIAGTDGVVELEDDDTYVVTLDFDSTPVTVPGSVWLEISVSDSVAGVLTAGPAQLGFSEDAFHIGDASTPELNCNAWFGGYPTARHASFYAVVILQDCAAATELLAYHNDAFSGLFYGGEPGVVIADDIDSAISECDIVRIELQYAGTAGPYAVDVQLHDDAAGYPGAALSSTMRFSGSGDGTLEEAVFDFDPPLAVASRFWITQSDDSAGAGPVIASGPAVYGGSADAFASDAGLAWNLLFFGGCGGGRTSECGSFNATIYCAGGAEAPTAACCVDGSCATLTAAACDDVGGTWQSGMSCGDPGQSCGVADCTTAAGDCLTAHGTPGCAGEACCASVCGVDDYCCSVEWDASCVAAAAELCTAVNHDACDEALAIGNGTLAFDTHGANTDGPNLPDGCDETFGLGFGADVWFDYTATHCGQVSFSTCNGSDFDTRMAVYVGCDCPVDNGSLAACNDDGVDCDQFAAHVTIPVEAGTCYKVRLGGFNGAQGEGVLEVTDSAMPCDDECPVGSVTFVDPPSRIVDARWPHSRNAETPGLGIDTLVVQAPLSGPSCWSLCESGGSRDINGVIDVASNGDGTVTLQLARPLTAGATTAVTYSATGITGQFTYHPGNVNGDAVTDGQDVLFLIDILNGLQDAPFGAYSGDIDHSGRIAPQDILAVTDLINGAGVFESWSNTARPGSASCP
jgi:hypothetical protein